MNPFIPLLGLGAAAAYLLTKKATPEENAARMLRENLGPMQEPALPPGYPATPEAKPSWWSRVTDAVSDAVTVPVAPRPTDPARGQRGVYMGKYFSYPEFFVTNTGLPNQPPDAEEGFVIANLKALTEKALDPIREALGPVIITSGYRSPAVNDAVGGSLLCRSLPGQRAPNSAEALRLRCGSQHLHGTAVDMKVPGRNWNSEQLAAAIIKLKEQGKVDFDQIVWYDPDQSSHVHISWKRQGTNRRVVRRKRASGYVAQAPRSGYSAVT